MKEKWLKVLGMSFFLVFSLPLYPQVSQQAPDYGKILGAWEVEVNAEGEFYYLSLNLEKSEEGLKGTVTESSGAFTDVPLENIQFEGQTLKFEFKSPTPPDGSERLVNAEFKVGDSKLEGSMAIADLGISVPATATKKVK